MFLVNMKKFIEKYNKKDNLIVISGYPKKKQTYSRGVCAVSSFAKNTLTALQKENPDKGIIVLTMEIDRNETYEEDGMLIIRCFKRNSPRSYFGLLKEIFKFRKVKNVLIEFEFASFGNTFMTGLLAPLTWALFLARKNITVVCHQVVSDIRDLSGHIGISPKAFKIIILNYGLRLFYALMLLPAKKIIVLEEEFKERLSKLTNPKKIEVLPHGIDQNIQRVSRTNARVKLGIKENEFVLLYFGYLTWYKGIDFLIKSLLGVNKINGRKIKLIVAGGSSFTQKEKKHYLEFLGKVNSLLKSKDGDNIITTGFVLEKDIKYIFTASDLAIFPYRIFMSSSGPMSLAISHNKPFILSENLAGLANSLDIKNALKISGVKKEDIIFKLSKKSLIKGIQKSMNNQMRGKMIKFSKILNTERSFTNLAKKYNQALFQETKSQTINTNSKT